MTAREVARWILSKNEVAVASNDAEYISNMKLQKLLYYAQGCHLALHDTVLFQDNIEAWKHGPVVPDVYHEYKRFGSNGIEIAQLDELDVGDFTDEQIDTLEQTYEVFGQYSAWKLREMTHSETPWLTTPANGVISINSIKQYFKENYVSG